MHGSPLLRSLLIALALLLAGLPLWHLTHGAAPAAASPPAADAGTASTAIPVRLAVAFATRPLGFEIAYLGKPLWREEAVPALSEEKTVRLDYPKEGIDLEYRVQWPPGTPLTAARLSVSPGEAEPVEKTLWGAGQVDDVLSFP